MTLTCWLLAITYLVMEFFDLRPGLSSNNKNRKEELYVFKRTCNKISEANLGPAHESHNNDVNT